MVSGSDQIRRGGAGVREVDVDGVGGTPGDQVVLEVLVAVPVLKLELDPLHAAGGAGGAVDDELDATRFDPTLDRVGDRGLVGA